MVKRDYDYSINRNSISLNNILIYYDFQDIFPLLPDHTTNACSEHNMVYANTNLHLTHSCIVEFLLENAL